MLLAAQPFLPRKTQPAGLLIERFPKLSAVLSRLPLTNNRPIPVSGARGLGQHLGLAQLHVKRDDLAGSVYAGSKVCKLEYLLGQARTLGLRHLVTGGSLGSHHALATAIHGNQQGFTVELLLMPEPPSEEVRNVLKASIHYAKVVHYAPTVRDLARQWQQALERQPSSTCSIPLGGTSPLGNAAYVEAALELERQVDQGELPEPARIYVPLGTMGCVVGLLLGLRLTRLKSRLIAVRASNPSTSSAYKLKQLYDATQQWLRAGDSSFPELPLDETAFSIDGRHLGEGYALPTAEGRHAMKLARDQEGLELELTYTAKALSALIVDAPKLRGQPILLWNTHAGPAPDCPWEPERAPKELRSYMVPREK